MGDENEGPSHMRLPYGETDPSKRYTMPDPDACAAAYTRVRERCFANAWPPAETIVAVDRDDLARVLALASGYLTLSTYTLGQECCVTKLRDVWRARRARDGE